MNHKSEILDPKTMVVNSISWIFGLVVLAIGIINTFWGNDPGFGIFLVLLSFVYYPPINKLTTRILGISIPLWVKISLGVFIIWAALGVGELFDKIDIMMRSM